MLFISGGAGFNFSTQRSTSLHIKQFWAKIKFSEAVSAGCLSRPQSCLENLTGTLSSYSPNKLS